MDFVTALLRSIPLLIAIPGLTVPAAQAKATDRPPQVIASPASAGKRAAHDPGPHPQRATIAMPGTDQGNLANASATWSRGNLAEPHAAMTVHIDQASHLLTGPWRFHLGDDPRWAASAFDDSRWERVNLAPVPGAHDGDVGLTDYVPGWWARGHEGYSGYAWYRMRIAVDVPEDTRIALLAPAYVEDAYQLFWNGALVGESGDFSGGIPVVYSTKPQVFPLPPKAAEADAAVIAIRVWMRSGLARAPDAGGIHIVPTLGTSDAIQALYRLEWLQTVKGYIVEVAEPMAFVLLAILAWCFRAAMARGRFVPWLCTALLLTAAYRLNQVVYYWTSYESLPVYLAVHRSLIPTGLAAWVMTWRAWFGLERWRWLTYGIGILTVLATALVLTLPHATFAMLSPIWRIPLAVVLLATGIAGLRGSRPDRLLAFIAVLLVAISQFSSELAALGVPYIWFPFGTGVSLTQYAYAGIIVGLAALLIRAVQQMAGSPKIGLAIHGTSSRG